MCCSPWGHKESDMTERLTFSLSFNDMPSTSVGAVHMCAKLL